MNILKELHQGLLLHFFGQENKQYLGVGCLCFFDLNEPESVLQETAMWPFLQQELGRTVFDSGYPKPYGEVLVWSKCFPPGNEPASSAVAGLRVGSVCKELSVYGTRYWHRTATGQSISDPEPFRVMNLGYQNAFGGPGFESNPLGMGIEESILPTGEKVVPLPHIENPGKEIGSPLDRPEPAGFGPYNLDWPQRKSKFGTFDRTWLNERWPFFPEDADWTFANAAPADQWLSTGYNDGFFKGDEQIRMTNMHPERPVYDSALPRLRQRCFVDLYKQWDDRTAGTRFKEIILRPETLWLFPHAERGILLFRGAGEVADDEGLDVKCIYLAEENLKDKPHSIEFYQRLYAEKLERGVLMDVEPMEEAEALMQEAEKKLAELPHIVRDTVDSILGRSPTEQYTSEELAALAQKNIASHKALIAEMAPMVEETRKQFGHLAKVDASFLQEAQQSLDALGKTADDLAAKKQQVGEQIATAKEMAKQSVHKGLDGHPLMENGMPEDSTIELDFDESVPSQQERWQRKARRFLHESRENLRESERFREYLHLLGLSDSTIECSWIGHNPTKRTESGYAWGLVDSRKEDEPFTLEPGLVVPYFDGPEIRMLMLRPRTGQFERCAKPAKGPAERFHCTRVVAGRPVVVSFFSIEYWLIRQDAGELCECIVLPRPDMELEPELRQTLAQAPQLLVLQYPSSDPHMTLPDHMLEDWQQLNPNAELVPMPRGLHLMQARNMGVRIDDWLRGLIKPELLPDESLTLQDKLDPKLDIPATVEKKISNARAAVMARMSEGKKAAAAHIAEAKAQFSDMGQSGDELDDVFASPGASGKPSDIDAVCKGLKKAAAKQIGEFKKQQEKTGFVPDSHLDALNETLGDLEKSAGEGIDQTAASIKQGMGKLQASMDELKKGPEWMHNLFRELGKTPGDLDEPAHLSREDVIRYLEQGRSLAGKNISELDLSGLDFSGQNLRGADMQKSVFTGSKLDNADLSEALAAEADFDGISMREAKMGKGLFQKASFAKTQLANTDFSDALLLEADFSKADLMQADLSGATLENAKCTESIFSGTKAHETTFIETNLADSVWRGAELSGSTFIDSVIDRGDFTGAGVSSVNVIGTSGHQTRFAGADLTNIRLLSESALPDADLSGATADRACFKETDLTGCNFQKASLNKAMIEDCNCSGTNFTGADAVDARLNRSNFTFSLLKGVNLLHGSIRKARLSASDMSQANFFGAEFYKAKVEGAYAEGTNFKRTKLEAFADSLFSNNWKG